MSIKKLLKLFFGLLVLGIGCASLILYENNAIATVGASSASILLPSYTVGSEYSGIVTNQYVEVGNNVKKGQQLFELTSDQLTSDLAQHNLTLAQLNYKQARDGGFIINAQENGVVSQVDTLKGSFVNAGTTMATITGTSAATVRANFELSGPEYAKIQPNTVIEVSLNGKNIRGTITSIVQQPVNNGKIITVIVASLPSVTQGQAVYVNGAPAPAKLILTTHTLYQRLLTKLHSEKFGHKL